jgi:hypothetical protein
VAKRSVDTCFHIHIQPCSTWSHVGRVERNAYATPKQTLKNSANVECSGLLSKSCGNSKTATPTHRVWAKQQRRFQQGLFSACGISHNQFTIQNQRKIENTEGNTTHWLLLCIGGSLQPQLTKNSYIKRKMKKRSFETQFFSSSAKIAIWALTYILVYVFSLLLQLSNLMLIYLGGDPAAGSPTATLLRLFPPCET